MPGLPLPPPGYWGNVGLIGLMGPLPPEANDGELGPLRCAPPLPLLVPWRPFGDGGGRCFGVPLLFCWLWEASFSFFFLFKMPMVLYGGRGESVPLW